MILPGKRGGPELVKRAIETRNKVRQITSDFINQTPRTSIQLSHETKNKLLALMRRGDTYESVLRRMLQSQMDVWFEILSVDGSPAVNHEVLVKVGNDPEKFYVKSIGQKKFTPVDEARLKVTLT